MNRVAKEGGKRPEGTSPPRGKPGAPGAGATRDARPGGSARSWRASLAITPGVLLVLAAILLLGAVLRGVYLTEIARQPDFKVPEVDADYHDYWARGLAFGSWTQRWGNPDPEIRTTPYFRPPGYPYFLALVYKLTGPGYVGPRVVQMLLGLVTSAGAFFLAAPIFGPAVGLVFAGMTATDWVFIFHEGELLDPALLCPLLLLLVYLLLRWAAKPRPLLALAAGILMGFIALIRPNALVLGPAVALWAWWILQRRRARARWTGNVAALFGGMALALLPATIRNWSVAHEFVPISSNGGINLYMGNNGRADGLVRGTLPDIGELDTCYDWPQIVARVERKLGRPMSHAEVSAYFSRGALRFLLDHPLDSLGLAGRKTLFFWGPKELDDSKVVEAERQALGVLRWNPWSFSLVLALGLGGIILLMKERRARPPDRRAGEVSDQAQELTELLLVILIVWFLSYLPFVITSRYRVPVIPFLMLFGAVFVMRVVGLLKKRNLAMAGRWAGLFVVLFLLAHLDPLRYQPSLARWHYERAIAYQRLGRRDEAVREYGETLQANPRHAAACNDLGTTLAQEGRMGEALVYFQRAVQSKPDDAVTRCNLAAAYEALGRPSDGRTQYEEALRIDPDSRRAQEGLARIQRALATGEDRRAPNP